MTNKGKMIETIYAACLSKRATLVIFYLINRANQELTCFPSVGTIARECNISTRTVQRALNDLEEAGFLERESRFHERGGQKSNLYKISEQVADVKQIEEIDFKAIKKVVEKPDYENTEKQIKTEECNEEEKKVPSNFYKNAVSKIINSMKNGLSYLLSWGL